MDEKDRLAYELAMVTLQDTREDCLRWLDDQEPAAVRRRSARWRSFGSRPAGRRGHPATP
jgi:hypothetical protein